MDIEGSGVVRPGERASCPADDRAMIGRLLGEGPIDVQLNHLVAPSFT
jgi:hypothetical protein